MRLDNNTLKTNKSKISFLEVMGMPVESRKRFIENHSPSMQPWQKKASLQ